MAATIVNTGTFSLFHLQSPSQLPPSYSQEYIRIYSASLAHAANGNPLLLLCQRAQNQCAPRACAQVIGPAAVQLPATAPPAACRKRHPTPGRPPTPRRSSWSVTEPVATLRRWSAILR